MNEATILKLHEIFCELTGQVGLSMRFDRQRVWWEWMQYGWGEPELREVVRYLRRGIAEGRRNPGALKFSNLIGQPDRFEEDLLESRRTHRPARPTTREARQPLPGGGERIVELPAKDDPTEISVIFDAMIRAAGLRK